MLGFWWLIQIGLEFIYLFTPYIWVYPTIILISFVPPFIMFIQLLRKNDDEPSRKMLYEMYKWFACVFGLLAEFGIFLYFYFGWNSFWAFVCGQIGAGAECYNTTGSAGFGILIVGVLYVGLIGVFRIYFLSVMKRYWEESKHGGIQAAAGVYVAQPQPAGMAVAYQQQPM